MNISKEHKQWENKKTEIEEGVNRSVHLCLYNTDRKVHERKSLKVNPFFFFCWQLFFLLEVRFNSVFRMKARFVLQGKVFLTFLCLVFVDPKVYHVATCLSCYINMLDCGF